MEGITSSQSAVPVESALYFYGNISRETAEWILWDRGCQDGMFLLRESNGDYVLSLCYQRSILHYRINKLVTGGVSLCGVPRQWFPGPIELVEGVEGLAIRPIISCNKSFDAILPPTHWGLTEDYVKWAMLKKAEEWGLSESDLESNMREDRNDIKLLLIKTLHEIQPWFHGLLSRVEAEKRLVESGQKDGKFLVRVRDDSSYALCLSHSVKIKHYKIDVLPSGEFAIQDGQRFPSIMALVSHYSLFSDGLWCALTEPCPNHQLRPADSSSIAIKRQDGDLRFRTTNAVQIQVPIDGGSGCSPTIRRCKIINQKSPLLVKPERSCHRDDISCLLENGDSPDLILHASKSPSSLPPPTPPHSRKSSIGSDCGSDSGKGRLVKASSFDFISAFLLSLFSTSDSRKKFWDRKFGQDGKLNGLHSEEEMLAVYATQELLSARDRCAGYVDGKESLEQTFVRSASSPAVVSQPKVSSSTRKLYPNCTPEATKSLPSSPVASAQSKAFSDRICATLNRRPLPPSCKKVWEISKSSSSSSDGTSPTLTEGSLDEPVLYTELDEELVLRADSHSSSSPLLSDDSISPDCPNDGIYATLSSTATLAGCGVDTAQPETEASSCTLSREESDFAYRTLRQCRRGPVALDSKSLIFKEKIGTGNFGDVWCGVFGSGAVEIQFAVKMLKNTVSHHKVEILKEAHTMAALDHPHIVRLIGVCEGDPFMLVMELAPLGPLNKHLRNHSSVCMREIFILVTQVCCAMEYLESRQYVHRDLAARNVLLVNDSFVKISDFGMSRALGMGKEYYRAEVAGKWPLKWYAPECIYYFKFSTKSDVWSFGVTLWECASYGEKPYQGMVGREILQMFERNERLKQPRNCPDAIYDLMRQCWQYRPEDRPTFAQLHGCLQKLVV